MIIFRYILKNHLAPFLFSSATLIAIFLLQFLMKFADKLIGKGLSAWVIIKLVGLNLGWIIVLVIPMAVLVATLMAFGNMAQNNEVAIFKASGISLYKMMAPPFIASIVVTFLLIMFNNHVYPESNHMLKILMQDISRKKPTLSLVPGVFSQEVPKHSILAKDLDPLTNQLMDLTIYDKSQAQKTGVITAKRGNIYFVHEQKKLIMDLFDGEIHNYDYNKKNSYTRIEFDKHRIALDGDQFSFKQSAPGGPRSDRELGAEQMIIIADSLQLIKQKHINQLENDIASQVTADSSSEKKSMLSKRTSRKTILSAARDRVRLAESNILRDLKRIESDTKRINKYWVEIHKKYSIPFACIVFILIGAPLGTMTRKGGFGVAAGISLIFFLIYWAFLIGGEKVADRGLLSPFWGMWSANILLGILGIYLTIKSARERVTLDFSYLMKFIPKKLRTYNTENENN